MSNFSAYTEQSVYNWALQNVAMPASPVTVYLDLSTADPLDDMSAIAPIIDAGAPFARQALAMAAPASVNGVGTSGANTGNIIFPTATVAWGIITHGIIYDALVAGNALFHFQWAVSKNIGIGDTYICAISDILVLIR